MTVDMQVRPLGPWPGGSRASVRRRSPFKASYSSTLGKLRKELDAIGCKKAILEAGYREDQIRADGWPKANVADPSDPGVVLRVIDSKHGALTYPCDTFNDHEDNLRAIALTLQAQRMIDRYGVTKRGEQYQGWKQLPAQGTTTLTAEAAASILVAHSNGHLDTKDAGAFTKRVLTDVRIARSVYRAATLATHPDREGGDAEKFKTVQQARGVLALHHGAPL